MLMRLAPRPPWPLPPAPPTPPSPPRPPLIVLNSDITVRRGSNSARCPSSSAPLSASDIDPPRKGVPAASRRPRDCEHRIGGSADSALTYGAHSHTNVAI